ncbi:MAG: complex I NDUFA9 subunit family protein [Pigmentiphaga sp.]|uniref:complex I NDUFA9 subunit family protein n=1 Tax=Pigmentiphaga sp. TaxID=1977564 RepID=UPI0029AA577B|nr:complex I NDUFA9 subunit family protein [Pigmentiphaga sp.]MDX3907068.1 complex I NDUFA9 subunit family protein [Pigmentiphaga sp.]
MSMIYPRILVLGGSGFIGSHLVARLAAQGRKLLVPTRRYINARHLLPLPTVDIVEADLFDDAALARLLQEQDAVINLVGVLHGDRGTPYGKTFRKLHVELPERIAQACVAKGVTRFLHMSALGADSKGASMYQRSKGDGEAAVRRVFDAWPDGALTIFRPSVVFGPDDRFLNMFASLARWLPALPVAGASARLQPIYVGDLTEAMANALDDRRTYGKAYPLAGPQAYTLRELIEKAAAWSGHRRRVVPLPMGLGKLQAAFMEMLPGTPLISRDNLDSLATDNVLESPLAPELGVHPSSLEALAPDYLARGEHTRFDLFRMRHGRR